MTDQIQSRLNTIRSDIDRYMKIYNRDPNSVQLLAVSKTRTSEEIMIAFENNQTCFGESYLQEALIKIDQLRDTEIEWHFIGRVQSNKTRPIAENFDWVHSVDKLKHAQRLNDQRPESLPPLNICLQINVDLEETKGGIDLDQAAELVTEISQMQRLCLRGLMTLPSPAATIDEQRVPFQQLRELRDRLATESLPLETLSMGMSGDIEAAIAEGATIVRVGTGIFGPRNYSNK